MSVSINGTGSITGIDQGFNVTSGSVGIGTDNPSHELDIESISPTIELRDSDNDYKFQLTQSGSATYVDFDTDGGGSSSLRIRNAYDEKVRIQSNGNTGIGTNDPGSNKLQVQGSSALYGNGGVSATWGDTSYLGALTFDGSAQPVIRTASSKSLIFQVNQSTEALRITGFGTCRLPDDGKLTLGDDDDLQIFHNGNYSYIKDTGTGAIVINTDGLYIKNASDTEYLANFVQDSAVSLYFDNSKKFETLSNGVKITGALQVTQEYPSIRPTLDLNFAATKTLDRRITFTRDSFGTYTDDMGILKYASNNVPRFDHDPATGESLGLLIEVSRTNLFTYSEAFNTSWTNIRSSDSGTTATADPEGNTTGAAYKLVANTDNNTHRLDRTNLSMSTSTTYTMSVWAKAAEYTGVSLTIADSSNSSHGIYFDLSNGTFTNGGNAHSGSMIAYPNGWYRCIATYTTPASFNFQQCLIGVLQNGTTHTYAGNNSSGIYIWGAQLEQGSFATSYIPTSGTTVTRAVDTAVIKGTNFTDWYDSSASTLFMESKLSSAISSGQYPFVAFEVESNNNRNSSFAITRRSGQGVRAINYDSSGTQDLDITNSTSWDGGTYRKFAYALDNSGSSSVLVDDGTVIGTDSSYATSSLSSVNILRFADHNSGGMTNFNVTIKSFKYYPKRLPNAQLQGLTQQ